MATIIDPLGTPTIVYNKSGYAVIPVTATGTSAATGASIPHVCRHQVILATVASSQFAAVLPGTADIGDVVEVIVPTDVDSLRLFVASGDTFNGNLNGGAIISQSTGGMRIIRTSANGWHSIGSA